MKNESSSQSMGAMVRFTPFTGILPPASSSRSPEWGGGRYATVVKRQVELTRLGTSELPRSRVDLIEKAAIGEMTFLSLGPTAEGIVNSDQL